MLDSVEISNSGNHPSLSFQTGIELAVDEDAEIREILHYLKILSFIYFIVHLQSLNKMICYNENTEPMLTC